MLQLVIPLVASGLPACYEGNSWDCEEDGVKGIL